MQGKNTIMPAPGTFVHFLTSVVIVAVLPLAKEKLSGTFCPSLKPVFFFFKMMFNSKLCSCSHPVADSVSLISLGRASLPRALGHSLVECVSPEHVPVSGGAVFHCCPATASVGSLSLALVWQVLLF